MSPSAVAELIPTHRFGALLAEKRLEDGRDLDDLALESGGRITAGELASIESGQLVVPETFIPLLSSLYDIPYGEVVPHRAKLCLDLHSRYLRVAHIETRLDTITQKAILDRYLSLLYLVRGVEPGSEQIPLRGDDLAILEASLRERSELLEEQLLAAMAANDPALKSLLDRLKKKLWVPGAGLLVGSVGIGALVFAGSAEDSIQGGLGGGDLAQNSLVLGESEIEEPIGFVLPDGVNVGDRTQVLSATESPTSTTSSTSTTTSTSTTSTAAPTTTSSTPPSTTSSTPPTPGGRNHDLFVGSTIDPGVDQGVVADAIGRLAFDVGRTLPEWEVVFRGPKQGFRGLTFTNEQRIELYVRDNDSPQFLAGVLAHELGHAYDLTYLNGELRGDWMEARGLEQWWVGASLTDFAAGQGDFAEAFAFAVAADEVHPGAHGAITPSQGEVLRSMLRYLQ